MDSQSAVKRGRRGHPSPPTLQTSTPPITSTSYPLLALGLGLGFLLIRSRTLKPLSFAIKLAGGAVEGARAVRRIPSSSSPHALLFASKALIKGYKASKRLNSASATAPPKPSPATVQRLRAYLSTVKLFRYASSPLLADRAIGLGFLTGGYKLSKNLVKVLEGLIGLQLDSAIRVGVDALGLLVKAGIIAEELGWRFGVTGEGSWKQTLYRFSPLPAVDFRYRVRLRCGRIDSGCNYSHGRGILKEYFDSDFAINGKDLETSIFELLSLSIPIHELETSARV